MILVVDLGIGLLLIAAAALLVVSGVAIAKDILNKDKKEDKK